MKLRFFYALCIILFALCAFIMNNRATENQTEQPLFGDRGLPQETLTDLRDRHVKMPTLPDMEAKYWFSTGDTLGLKGKVVLVDFWDYTCVNCIRTLPYLKEWHGRYKDDGLVILGVHSPEFEFAKKRENVVEALNKFGIDYPVVMDNDFKIWNLFGNQYWPAKYLFDKDGTLRYVHFGEGGYGNFEKGIQKLLKEANPDLKLPPIMDPVRATDVPGAVCYRTTPETYLGYDRGSIGNKEGYSHNEAVSYSEPSSVEKDRFYLVGKWDIEPQFVRYAGCADSGMLIMNYISAEVNLVIRPAFASNSRGHDPFRVYVSQDEKPVPKEDWASDVHSDSDGMTYVMIDAARMYYLIKNREYGRHTLTLRPTSDEFAAYAFTFVTACETPAN
jgi:thiol-disulfide isomerase/thioredoxin